MKVRNSKVYGAHRNVNDFLGVLMFICTSHFLLTCLPEGKDSGFAWWCLCFLAGGLISIGIKKIVRSTSQKIWPLNQGQEVLVIAPSRSFLKACYMITFLLQAVLVCFFGYMFLTSELSDTTFGDYVIMVALATIFLAGSVFNLQKLRKLL